MSTFMVGARKDQYVPATPEQPKTIFNLPGSSALSVGDAVLEAGESVRVVDGRWICSAGQSRVMVSGEDRFVAAAKALLGAS